MIVSALVATTVGAGGELEGSFVADHRVEFGERQKAFVPLVTTAESLRMARDLFEQISAHPCVADLQLISWVDESVEPPLPASPHSEGEQR